MSLVKQKLKPIGITFNPHNSQIIILCDDSTIWGAGAESLYRTWRNITDFPEYSDPQNPEHQKKYRETGI